MTQPKVFGFAAARGSAVLACICAMSIAFGVIGFAPAVAAAQGPAPQQATGQNPPTTSPAQSPPAQGGVDADAIRRLIEERMKQSGASPAAQPRPTTPPQQPAGQPTVVQPGAPFGGIVPPATQPAGHGCGGIDNPVDLNPPAPDQPQPRWVCDQPLVEAEPVWRGQPGEFLFKVRNAGEAVLNIKLTKG